MKKITLLPVAFLFLSITFSAQVGVNTSSPNSTMDVSAKRDSGGNISDNTQIFGLQAPRITLAELTANTATYGTNQTGALIYITDVSGGTTTGQRVNIDEVGYYSFDGNVWKKLLYKNIYNADGSLTGTGTYRTLTLNGKGFNVTGTNQRSSWNSAGVLYQENLLGAGNSSAIVVSGGNSSDLYLQQFYNGAAQIQAAFNSTSLDIATNGSASSAPVTISTSSGGGALKTEKMRITGNGNVGISTNSPTEKLDNSGITRLRTLPLNGATNAIYTTSGGTASANQDQTFTATRTVVADANGVLGYVAGTPSSPGVPKLLVSAGVPGTQNIKGNVNIVGNYSVEYLDVYNTWTSNVFTVPAGQTGVYIVAMQTSHLHTVDASSSWFTIARIQKSTDGGTTWVNVLNDTQASNLGTDVDNGNKLYWTSALNAGDKIRIVYQCSSIGDNIVTLGSLTITQLNQ